jgi:hypothetical protein
VPQVGPEDVFIFFYAGHGWWRSDGPTTDEFDSDPVKDNDVAKDDQGRLLKFDERVGVNGAFWMTGQTDDAILTALSALPATTKKVLIFEMCYANGNCRGNADPSLLPNSQVFTSSSEGEATPIANDFAQALETSLLDVDVDDGFGDADVDLDNHVTANEWLATASARYSTMPSGNCPSAGGGPERAIAVDFNDTRNPLAPGAAGDGKLGGPGCGPCSDPDFGDAPENNMVCSGAARNYGTTIAFGGPRYNEWIAQYLGPADPPNVEIGKTDAETDGQPGCGADEGGVPARARARARQLKRGAPKEDDRGVDGEGSALTGHLRTRSLAVGLTASRPWLSPGTSAATPRSRSSHRSGR